MHCGLEWGDGIYNPKFTNTREISNIQLSKETGLIKEITATKPYATQTRKRQFTFNECL